MGLLVDPGHRKRSTERMVNSASVSCVYQHFSCCRSDTSLAIDSSLSHQHYPSPHFWLGFVIHPMLKSSCYDPT